MGGVSNIQPQFYEEAEKNFELGSRLSFTLMCGAVFEGMLYAELYPNSKKPTFNELIKPAHRARKRKRRMKINEEKLHAHYKMK